MKKEFVQVLIVEDDEDDFFMLIDTLSEIDDKSINYQHASAINEAKKLVQKELYDICICDYRIGTASGIDFIQYLEEANIDLPVIMVSGQKEDDIEVVAANIGACDFIDKQRLTVKRLNTAIRYTLARKAREDLQKAHDDAERVASLHSAFLSLIGHELRTPINGILGFCELMQSEIYGELGAEQYRGYLHDIHRSGKRLHETVESILDFTQLIAGTAETDDESIIPTNEIDFCTHSLRHAILAKSIDLEVNIDQNAWLIADRNSLRKMLSSLIGNSIKFSGQDGKVQITFSINEKDECCFEVSDRGEGIPRRAVPQILQPFRQNDDGLNRQFEGLGLGLALVHGLMELHGGRVDVGTTDKGGAKVGIIFPANRTTYIKDGEPVALDDWLHAEATESAA